MKMKNRNRHVLKSLVKGLVILFILSSNPQVRGVEKFILEPYLGTALECSGESAYRYVDRLTQDDFEARLSGTEGCDKAAAYIASEFSSIGLTPYQTDSYFQPLPVPYFNLMPPFAFQYREGKDWTTPQFRKDFIVFHYSGRGKISNSCVFIGYGLKAPELTYNDYEGVSVTNKTVLMLIDLPSFMSKESKSYSIYNRIDTAFGQGASSVLLLSENAEDIPFRFDMKMSMGFDAKLPVIITHPDLSRKLLQTSSQNLDDIIQTIERSHKPKSFLVKTDMQIEINFVMEQRTSSNVIGYIPAIDTSVKESILITSHYDGLGIDYLENTMYQGANDNASSTGCVMEIARILKQRSILPAINIVFIAFTGEEVGLYGSYHYVKNPLFPLNKIVAVLNMEEVGTFEGINIMGTDRSVYPELGKMIYQSAKLLKTKVSFYPEMLYPGSDHWPFHERGVPSVCFARLPIPNGYPEYHMLSDTIDIISPKSLELFCHLISLMTLSYSKASFFDFSGFLPPKDVSHPFMTFSSSCYVPLDSELSIYINKQKLLSDVTNRLELFIPLPNWENTLTIEIKFKGKTWIEESFVIKRKTKQNPNLRADFNLDYTVDISDLVLLSQKLELPASPYSLGSLYDLNQDSVIDFYDFAIFQEHFGQR
jgi:hypothetical protein